MSARSEPQRPRSRGAEMAVLATAGFLADVFDRSTLRVAVVKGGAVDGAATKRLIEDAEQRVRDYRDVIDYLQRLPYVDPERIGILGICGGGGYSIKTTIIDKRIKALVSITGVNFGRLFREGFSGFNPVGTLEAMARLLQHMGAPGLPIEDVFSISGRGTVVTGRIERGRIKVEIGLAKGKKQHDKRETEKNREWDREKARLMRNKG